MAQNIVVADFNGRREVQTRPLYRYDYGQWLVFRGVELPTAYEVHFSVNGQSSTTSIGGEGGVLIPNTYLASGENISAWIYLHAGENDGETVYRVTIPVRERPTITNYEPTPEEQGAIEQAIAALNAAVEQTARDVVTTSGYAEDASRAATAANSAATSAASSAGRAVSAEENAAGYANTASEAAGRAETAENNAQGYASAAEGYAADAARDADRAEQAANTAGYLDVEIDERGHLIYVRTDMVDVDFALVDGHLIMEAV